jgi:hypothetical protein
VRLHGEGAGARPLRVIGLGYGRPEKREQLVAHIFHECALGGKHLIGHFGVVIAEHRDDLVGRMPLGKTREAFEVTQQRGQDFVLPPSRTPAGFSSMSWITSGATSC